MPTDFVLVAGEEWIEIENASALAQQAGMGADYLRTLIETSDFTPVTQWAEDVGILPAGKVVTAGRMFALDAENPGEINLRLWLIFGDAPA